MKKIKWGCIQPLTGGMYIGAANAIGNDAEWIISYKGFNDVTKNKSGEITNVGNEYNLTEWLKKNNRNIPYYTFNHKPFENPSLNEVYIDNFDNSKFNDIDIVVAVPVCSGLSMVTSGSKDMKDTRNCNMLFIANYTLSVIKPKFYIFENAPTLMGNRGDEIREELENIANNTGYSILYYKTDTQFHDNAQKRSRTFIIFQKWNNNKPQLPSTMNFEDKQINIVDYLNRIPEDATQQDLVFEMSPLNKALLDYTKYKFGDNWRNESRPHPLDNIVKENLYTEFIEYTNTLDFITNEEKTKIEKFIRHAEYKKSLGLNFMSEAIAIIKDKALSIQFKSMNSMLHPIEDRLLNVRECLHLMGMPHDFEMLGNPISNYAKIGQNVPVRTAQFIISEVLNNLNNWETSKREEGNNTLFIDNIKKIVA